MTEYTGVPNIRMLRERAGVSQLALSRRLGCHPADLSKLESAIKPPDGLVFRAAEELRREVEGEGARGGEAR